MNVKLPTNTNLYQATYSKGGPGVGQLLKENDFIRITLGFGVKICFTFAKKSALFYFVKFKHKT